MGTDARDPFEAWYSVQAIAARFVTGLDRTISERTIQREIERQPVLKAAAVHKFGLVFLPWRAVASWLQLNEAAPRPPGRRSKPVLLAPVVARSAGELHRKLLQTSGGGQ